MEPATWGALALAALLAAAWRRAARRAERLRRMLRDSQVEAALAERERGFLRRVVDAVPVLLFAKDRTGAFHFANRAIERLYGARPGGLLGKRDADFNPQVEEVEGFLADDLRVIEGEEERLVLEESVTGADGEALWLKTTKVPLLAHDGASRLSLGVGTDITRRREAELALERARDAAEAASRARTRFLANISHELRTPLTGILGLSDLLAAGDLDEEQRGYLELVRSSSRVLLRLIDDVLHYSRLEADELPFEEEPFRPSRVLEDLAEDLRLRIADRPLVLVTSIPPATSAAVVGDRLRLRQVVLNLLDNAVKFTPEGEIRLEAEVEPRPGDRLELTLAVEDSGPGIPAEERERVFQAFQQLDTSPTRGHGGAGLGLAIVRRLVERMGGEVGVAEGRQGGARVWIRVALPRAGEDVAVAGDRTAPSLPPPAPPGSAAQRILLVEDHPVNQVLVEAILVRQGFEVEVAATGHEALERLAARAYDLVLMDLHMPGIDGLETTRRLRAREAEEGRRPTPVLALTALAMEGDRERCLEAGMDGYVSKPVLPADLVAAVRAQLEEG